MFILTLMLYCTSKPSKIQVAKVATKDNSSRQGEIASRIGDRIGRNFDPCETATMLVNQTQSCESETLFLCKHFCSSKFSWLIGAGHVSEFS